jgi:hypothetical protein
MKPFDRLYNLIQKLFWLISCKQEIRTSGIILLPLFSFQRACCRMRQLLYITTPQAMCQYVVLFDFYKTHLVVLTTYLLYYRYLHLSILFLEGKSYYFCLFITPDKKLLAVLWVYQQAGEANSHKRKLSANTHAL